MIAPRLLTLKQAASYLGDIPINEMKRVSIGRVRWGRYCRYDRVALDRELDRIAGLSAGLQSSETIAEDSAEAAIARFQARHS